MTEKEGQLRVLRDLQDLEGQIAALESAVEGIPKAVHSIESEVSAARAEQAALEERRKGLERDRMKREADIEAEREHLRKAQAKQLDVKTNKEYSALLHEIEGINKRIDGFETEILELMEAAETMIEGVREGAARLREKEADAEARKKEKNEELAGIQRRLSELREDHERLSAQADPEWLAEYARIKAARGWAVAGLNGNSCSGCHQSLMLQLVHEVRHGDEIRTCPHCNRILYAPEEAPRQTEAANPAEPKQA